MLKKTVLGLTAGALLLSAGSALAADYKIDKQGQHAFIEFRIQHLGYSWLYGSFKDFDGGFTFDEKDPSKDKVNVTINTASVDTNHAERDKHLRSAEFLNVEKNKQAKFESTEVKKKRRRLCGGRQPDAERRDQARYAGRQTDWPGQRSVGRLPRRL